MSRRLIDLSGQTFGRLTVIERAPNGSGGTRWHCKCECGIERTASSKDLRAGEVWFCGTVCILAAGRRPWPRNPRYYVGEDGSIVGPRGWVLAPQLTENGYLQVDVRGSVSKRITVHIIVCETFHGPRPEGMEVAHANGVRTDCRAANLSWKTRSDNHADKLAHGTAQRGETANNRKLTEREVLEIRARAARGESYAAIGRAYDVSRGHVRVLVLRECWAHI